MGPRLLGQKQSSVGLGAGPLRRWAKAWCGLGNRPLGPNAGWLGLDTGLLELRERKTPGFSNQYPQGTSTIKPRASERASPGKGEGRKSVY